MAKGPCHTHGMSHEESRTQMDAVVYNMLKPDYVRPATIQDAVAGKEEFIAMVYDPQYVQVLSCEPLSLAVMARLGNRQGGVPEKLTKWGRPPVLFRCRVSMKDLHGDTEAVYISFIVCHLSPKPMKKLRKMPCFAGHKEKALALEARLLAAGVRNDAFAASSELQYASRCVPSGAMWWSHTVASLTDATIHRRYLLPTAASVAARVHYATGFDHVLVCGDINVCGNRDRECYDPMLRAGFARALGTDLDESHKRTNTARNAELLDNALYQPHRSRITCARSCGNSSLRPERLTVPLWRFV